MCVLSAKFLRGKPSSKIAVVRDVHPLGVALSHPPSRRRFCPLPSRRSPTARRRRTTFTKGQYASGRRADRTREVEALYAEPSRYHRVADHRIIFARNHQDSPPRETLERDTCVIRDVILLLAPVNSGSSTGIMSNVNCWYCWFFLDDEKSLTIIYSPGGGFKLFELCVLISEKIEH